MRDRQIKAISGQFLSEGHPVDDFHCEPATPGKHPVVLLIHGCALLGFGDDEFQQMCVSVGEHGYYAMLVEYFSRTGQPNCREHAMDETYNRVGPTTVIPDNPWESAILSAGSSLAKNPKADATRFGLIGFSFGGMLAVRTGLFYPNVVKAVVLYYPITNYRLEMAFQRFSAFPPDLARSAVRRGLIWRNSVSWLHNPSATGQAG